QSPLMANKRGFTVTRERSLWGPRLPLREKIAPLTRIVGIERVLDRRELIAVVWLWNREIGRNARVQQAGALELLDARQVANRVEAEMGEERLGRAVSDRATRRAAPSAHPDPASLEQHVERALTGHDPPNLLDLGAGHRLVVGNDGERFERGSRQPLLLDRVA